MPVLRAALFTIYFYGLTALLSVLAVPLLIAPANWIIRYGRWWVRATLAGLRLLVGLDHRVEGLHHVPPGAALIAAQHQSAWDTMVYRLLIDDMVPVMKRELALIPIWGWLVLRAGAIAVDRRGGSAALRALIRAAARAKRRGRRILIFPEGTRVAPGEHRAFQSGVAALYTALDLPVIPVAVNSGLFWPRRSLFGQRPGRITVRVLPPIAPGLPRAAFMQRLEAAIRAAGDELAGVGTDGGGKPGHP